MQLCLVPGLASSCASQEIPDLLYCWRPFPHLYFLPSPSSCPSCPTLTLAEDGSRCQDGGLAVLHRTHLQVSRWKQCPKACVALSSVTCLSCCREAGADGTGRSRSWQCSWAQAQAVPDQGCAHAIIPSPISRLGRLFAAPGCLSPHSQSPAAMFSGSLGRDEGSLGFAASVPHGGAQLCVLLPGAFTTSSMWGGWRQIPGDKAG